MLTLIFLIILVFFFAVFLGWASVKFVVKSNSITEKINDILPQTQCAQCGYPGCRPYAEAIANNEADINLCPPGGEATIQELANLLGVEPKKLSEEVLETKPPMVAKIIEEECIGCMICIKACPVDAISGTTKMMHTVIVDECTGCELCVEPCPMDCIVMEELQKKPKVIKLAENARPIPLIEQYN